MRIDCSLCPRRHCVQQRLVVEYRHPVLTVYSFRSSHVCSLTCSAFSISSCPEWIVAAVVRFVSAAAAAASAVVAAAAARTAVAFQQRQELVA